MDRPFVLFGAAHLTVLALMLLVPATLVFLARRNGPASAQRMALALGSILLFNEGFSFFWKWHTGILTIHNGLPMHLCDWATFTTVIACFWRPRWAYELSYFWGLAGTLQAVLTPDLRVTFPNPTFVIFFLAHAGLIASVLYLTFAFPLRPTWRSIGRAYGWLLFYAACAGAVDWATGANYGYLRAKPLKASLLDYFGPWPWYIPVTTLLALAFFLIYYSPFAIADVWRARRKAGSTHDSIISKT